MVNVGLDIVADLILPWNTHHHMQHPCVRTFLPSCRHCSGFWAVQQGWLTSSNQLSDPPLSVNSFLFSNNQWKNLILRSKAFPKSLDFQIYILQSVWICLSSQDLWCPSRFHQSKNQGKWSPLCFNGSSQATLNICCLISHFQSCDLLPTWTNNPLLPTADSTLWNGSLAILIYPLRKRL